MKRLVSLLLCTLTLLSLSACGNAMARLENDGYTFIEGSVVNDTGSKELYVFNWGEYMRTDLNKAFEYETGIRVHYSTYDTNEDMYAKLHSGTASYDLIIPSDYMISLLIEEEMLEPLDFSRIPRFADIDPALKNPLYDPENLYSVPYTWGTVGIVYNKTMVEGEIDSWSALFDERYEGNILMFDNARDAMGIALKLLGYSFNTTDENQLREAQALLKEQKDILQAYVMDQIFNKMENNEAALAPYYAGDAISMMESNEDLAFVIPKEGTNLFVDAFCIPKGAQNKAAAELYINFMCGTQAGLANVETTGYSTPLLTVYNELDEEVRNDGISYVDLTDPRFEVFINLPLSVRKTYSDLWSALRA